MFSPEMGKAGFQMAMFIVLVSSLLLWFLQPGTAEFIVVGASLILGLLFAGLIWLLVRRFSG